MAIQEEQGRRRKMMNLTRIQRFLEAMDQYGKVIRGFPQCFLSVMLRLGTYEVLPSGKSQTCFIETLRFENLRFCKISSLN
jgi:hypothetical protein